MNAGLGSLELPCCRGRPVCPGEHAGSPLQVRGCHDSSQKTSLPKRNTGPRGLCLTRERMKKKRDWKYQTNGGLFVLLLFLFQFFLFLLAQLRLLLLFLVAFIFLSAFTHGKSPFSVKNKSNSNYSTIIIPPSLFFSNTASTHPRSCRAGWRVRRILQLRGRVPAGGLPPPSRR